MSFVSYYQLREELAIGQQVPVLRTNGQWDTGWVVIGFDLNNQKVRVGKQGVGIKDVPQDTLLQWIQKQQPQPAPQPAKPAPFVDKYAKPQENAPEHDLPKDEKGYVDVQKIGKAAYNKWFWDRQNPNAPRTAEFYIEKAMEWMRYQGTHLDWSVRDRDQTWYKQRANEIMEKVKSYKGPLFRCIACKDVQNVTQEINWQQVGLSWAFEERGADCYLGHDKGTPVRIQGYIAGPQAIDMDTTILYYLIPHYSNEKEFRLKRGAGVQVIQGEIQSNNYQTPHQMISLNIMAKA